MYASKLKDRVRRHSEVVADALVNAAQVGQVEVVARVVSTGAGSPIRLAPSSGNTPLHAAAAGRHADVLQVLVEQGVVDCRKGKLRAGWADVADSDGRSPLCVAAQWGDAKAVELLLMAGANPNFRGYAGRQPLHEACENGHPAALTMLLKHKNVDPWVADESYLAPREVAENWGRYQLAETLMAYEAWHFWYVVKLVMLSTARTRAPFAKLPSRVLHHLLTFLCPRHVPFPWQDQPAPSKEALLQLDAARAQLRRVATMAFREIRTMGRPPPLAHTTMEAVVYLVFAWSSLLATRQCTACVLGEFMRGKQWKALAAGTASWSDIRWLFGRKKFLDTLFALPASRLPGAIIRPFTSKYHALLTTKAETVARHSEAALTLFQWLLAQFQVHSSVVSQMVSLPSAAAISAPAEELHGGAATGAAAGAAAVAAVVVPPERATTSVEIVESVIDDHVDEEDDGDEVHSEPEGEEVDDDDEFAESHAGFAPTVPALPALQSLMSIVYVSPPTSPLTPSSAEASPRSVSVSSLSSAPSLSLSNTGDLLSPTSASGTEVSMCSTPVAASTAVSLEASAAASATTIATSSASLTATAAEPVDLPEGATAFEVQLVGFHLTQVLQNVLDRGQALSYKAIREAVCQRTGRALDTPEWRQWIRSRVDLELAAMTNN